MDEKFYVTLEANNTSAIIYETNSREDAEMKAKELAERHQIKTYVFTPILTVKPPEINEKVDSFEKACKYLDRHTAYDCENEHHKAILAIFKLVTIAEAWNNMDGFVPDFSNQKQRKYYTWFRYDSASAGFVSANPNSVPSDTYTSIGSRLCFKTSERARQFGEQFIDLWNDFLLIK